MIRFYESVLDQDVSPVVICDLEHTVLYMNPVAIARYANFGGEKLIGKSLMNCHPAAARAKIEQVVAWFAEDVTHNRVYTFYNEQENKDVYMIALRDQDGKLIGYYEKHEYRNRETAALYELPKGKKNGNIKL